VSAAAERAIAWRHGYHAAVCSRIEPWAHGTIARAPDVPSYYDYNLARVENRAPDLDAEALAAAAEPALADLDHRRIEVEDEMAGARVAPGFAAMGWVVERLAFLHRELPAPATVGAHGAELRVEAFEASRPLRMAWQGESIWGDPPGFVLIEEQVAARRGTRAAVGYLEGEPAGFAGFSAHGDTVEIETLFCLPERRNGGLGGALVARALEEAHAHGARHALIEADDTGDAKRLYERLGFRTVWVRHSFTRAPAGGRD
jgi:ribosomal protein S18 acetylase RimI-like enzyme